MTASAILPRDAGLSLAPDALDALRVQLCSAYPYEGCGLLLGKFCASGCCYVSRAKAARNTETAGATERFKLDPRDLQTVEKQLVLEKSGECVAGFYHSHPDAPARPSHTDLECALGLYDVTRFLYVYVIGEVRARELCALSAWQLDVGRGAFRELGIH